MTVPGYQLVLALAQDPMILRAIRNQMSDSDKLRAAWTYVHLQALSLVAPIPTYRKATQPVTVSTDTNVGHDRDLNAEFMASLNREAAPTLGSSREASVDEVRGGNV